MSFLKPKAPKSSSENVNRGVLTSAYQPQVQTGVTANNYLQSLLTGQGDVGAANAGYQSYLQRAGFQPAMRELARGVTGAGAAGGLLRSGSTAQRLQSRGAELNNQFFNNYLQQLLAQSNAGLQAGNLIANVGQRSTSTGGAPSTFGSIASAAGGIASIFSDRKLKTDIEKIAEMPDGLNVYRFRYFGQPTEVVGVMADEVAKLRPHALGPQIAGFATVDYRVL